MEPVLTELERIFIRAAVLNCKERGEICRVNVELTQAIEREPTSGD